MSRLEGDVARVALSERGQKDFNVDGHELQTRRQLHKQAAQALAERRRLLDKCIEGAVDVYESLFMFLACTVGRDGLFSPKNSP